jgi:hypothetical protein
MQDILLSFSQSIAWHTLAFTALGGFLIGVLVGKKF